MNTTCKTIQKCSAQATCRRRYGLGGITSRLSLLRRPVAAAAAIIALGYFGLCPATAGSEPKYIELPELRHASTGLSKTNALASPATGVDPAATNSMVVPKIMDVLDGKHGLVIGDRLSFRIEEDLEDPKSLVVTDSGDLEVPYIGRFPAEGKTCRQLAIELKAALEKDFYYQATVIIAVDQMAKSRGKVYLVGPVHVPGPQEIPSDEILTLSKAILRAGGFTDYADRHNVKVTRKGRAGDSGKKTFVVDVGQVFDKGKVELDLVLEPGDLIFVPERLVRF